MNTLGEELCTRGFRPHYYYSGKAGDRERNYIEHHLLDTQSDMVNEKPYF
jgi:hypothetical protein